MFGFITISKHLVNIRSRWEPRENYSNENLAAPKHKLLWIDLSNRPFETFGLALARRACSRASTIRLAMRQDAAQRNLAILEREIPLLFRACKINPNAISVSPLLLVW